jgi:CBS domain-containing protein
MKVRDAMTADVALASPDDTLRDAAQAMLRYDFGALPVGEGDRLVGMLTDRDIAVRAVAMGLGPDTLVRDVMSPEVKYCYAEDDLGDAAANMGALQVRRLPVLDAEKRLVGIVSLSDVANFERSQVTGRAVAEVSMPGGEHSQAAN